MPEAPDLIIPLRIDASKAIGGLSAAGTKAGDAVATGAGKAKKGLDGAEGGADKFGSSLASLTKAQIGLGLIKQTAAAIGSAFNDTAKYVQEMAKEFQGLRKTMQEVATLKGVGNTNKFTVEEAKKGSRSTSRHKSSAISRRSFKTTRAPRSAPTRRRARSPKGPSSRPSRARNIPAASPS